MHLFFSFLLALLLLHLLFTCVAMAMPGRLGTKSGNCWEAKGRGSGNAGEAFATGTKPWECEGRIMRRQDLQTET